jgi:hypothetical protein
MTPYTKSTRSFELQCFTKRLRSDTDMLTIMNVASLRHNIHGTTITSARKYVTVLRLAPRKRCRSNRGFNWIRFSGLPEVQGERDNMGTNGSKFKMCNVDLDYNVKRHRRTCNKSLANCMSGICNCKGCGKSDLKGATTTSRACYNIRHKQTALFLDS